MTSRRTSGELFMTSDENNEVIMKKITFFFFLSASLEFSNPLLHKCTHTIAQFKNVFTFYCIFLYTTGVHEHTRSAGSHLTPFASFQRGMSAS